jgi:exodeoxyribonuclease VII small subunit
MTKTSPPIAEMEYEKALSELEMITASLETGKLSLEESMKLFERGQALANRCNQLLDEAELKIKTLGQSVKADNQNNEE